LAIIGLLILVSLCPTPAHAIASSLKELRGFMGGMGDMVRRIEGQMGTEAVSSRHMEQWMGMSHQLEGYLKESQKVNRGIQ
jgi:hypothetical protein